MRFFGSILNRILADFGNQVGAQQGPQIDLKWELGREVFLDDLLIDQQKSLLIENMPLIGAKDDFGRFFREGSASLAGPKEVLGVCEGIAETSAEGFETPL